jgi:hypothetical protein
MIKFFRKIRQNLLSDGKTGKYLKYAVGEILLVMVGILLALQVNNWNEQRKNNNALKTALVQIISDLKQDEINLKNFESSDMKRVYYLTKFSNGEYGSIALDSLLYNLDNYFYFYKSNNSYSGLKENGMFSPMKNIILKNIMTGYYEQMYERLKTVSQYGETFTNDRIIPFIIENMDYDQNLLITDELLKEKIETTNLVQLAKYQINVKNFSLNLMKRALEMNTELRVEIERELEILK